jgi:imidazolonepropionase-like amidohydrolase
LLKQATSNSAELLSKCNSRNPYKDAPLGVIEEGAWADLLIYSGNPLKDIGVVVDYKKNLKVVMKNGVNYKNELEADSRFTSKDSKKSSQLVKTGKE